MISIKKSVSLYFCDDVGSLVTRWYANNTHNTESCYNEKYEDWSDTHGEKDLAIENKGCEGGR